MPKPPKPPPENEADALWQHVTRDLDQRYERPAPNKPATPQTKKAAASSEKARAKQAGTQKTAPNPAPAAPPTLDRRTEQRLRRGLIPIEATLDLHGLTQIQAEHQLTQFILQARASGLRCLCVVTGKGERNRPSILRQKLPEWLTAPALAPHVLKCVQAQIRDGGLGAFYVYLKKKDK